MPNVRTQFNGGGMNTTIDREGVEIREPDFWSDFDKMQRRRKPKAREQAQAMTEGTPSYGTRALPETPRRVPSVDQQIWDRANFMASRDPDWGGILKSGNLVQKWLPYATSVQGINIPNGWDQYAKIMAAGAPMSATAEGTAGENLRQQRAMGYGV